MVPVLLPLPCSRPFPAPAGAVAALPPAGAGLGLNGAAGRWRRHRPHSQRCRRSLGCRAQRRRLPQAGTGYAARARRSPPRCAEPPARPRPLRAPQRIGRYRRGRAQPFSPILLLSLAAFPSVVQRGGSGRAGRGGAGAPGGIGRCWKGPGTPRASPGAGPLRTAACSGRASPLPFPLRTAAAAEVRACESRAVIGGFPTALTVQSRKKICKCVSCAQF